MTMGNHKLLRLLPLTSVSYNFDDERIGLQVGCELRAGIGQLQYATCMLLIDNRKEPRSRSEKTDLLRGSFCGLADFSKINLHSLELFVRHQQQSDFPIRR